MSEDSTKPEPYGYLKSLIEFRAEMLANGQCFDWDGGVSDLPKSIRVASVHLYGVDMIVHQLDNGRRAVEEASMLALIEAISSLPTAPDESGHVQAAINEIFFTPSARTPKQGAAV